MDLTAWATGLCLAGAGFHVTSIAVAAIRLRLPRGLRAGDGLQPAVSLVRPVCGLDNCAAETLASSFRIDYPRYEAIFCVAEADDPVVPLVRSLIEANPKMPARLLVGDDRIGINPKLNNIAKGWEAARYDWIIVADSNVMLPADAIRQLLARWTAGTGAVCSMPIGSRPHSFFAAIECAFLNTLQARVQYVSEALGFGFAQGKTILFRRRVVEQAGGLAALAIDTAEDAAATKLVRAAGLRVRLVDAPFEQPLGWRTASEVWARQLRWARLRRASFPWLFVPEIAGGGLFPAVAAAIAAAGHGIDPAAALAVFLALWFGAELGLARIVGWHCSWRLLLALVVRDLLLPALWLMAFAGNEFVWRGNPMRLTNVPSPAAAARRVMRVPLRHRLGGRARFR